MAVTQLSQKDYLKKYLSSSSDDKKKKKKKLSKTAHGRFRVVDDDIDLKNMRPLDEDELDLYHLAEDAPQIAGIVDDRPDHMRTLEEFRGSNRWKVMSDEHGNDLKVTSLRNEDKNTSRLRDKSDVLDGSSERRYDFSRESKKISNEQPGSDLLHVMRYQSDSDESTTKKSAINSDSNVSSSRKSQKERSFSDIPPRKNKKTFDSDSSPTRNYKHDPNLSPKRSNSDVSPLRKGKDIRKNQRDSNLSPQRLNKLSSPIRKNKHNTDTSPVNRNRHNIDLSPTRKSKNTVEGHSSVLRRTRFDVLSSRRTKCYSDESPPRKSEMQYDSGSSPPRKSRQSQVDVDEPSKNSMKSYGKTDRRYEKCGISDTSSHRKASKRFGSPVGQSGKRSKDFDSEHSGEIRRCEQQGHFNRSESPHRTDRHRNISESPPRKSRDFISSENSSTDNSPHRTSKVSRNLPSPKSNASRKNDSEVRGKVGAKITSQSKRDKVKEKMEKTLEGKKAGLQDAKELKQEISDFTRREEELFAQMNDEISGKGAKAIMRDRKTGKRRNLEEEGKQKEEEDKKVAEHKEKYLRWGKGLKQVEEQKENLQQALLEMSKPLARYADDDDLEQHLRNQEREGDPMLDYIRSRKTEDVTKSKPKYQGSFLPNRFGISPGHRWDGVDRSNGYEKQWFQQQNSRRAVEEEAYKWSTSDM